MGQMGRGKGVKKRVGSQELVKRTNRTDKKKGRASARTEQNRTVLIGAKKPLGTIARQKAFLRAFEKMPVIFRAAKAARVSRTQVYAWKSDPEFMEALRRAFNNAVDELVVTAHKRAKAGSDRLLEMLLTAYRRKIFGKKIEHSYRDDPELQTIVRITLDVLLKYVPSESVAAALSEYRARLQSLVDLPRDSTHPIGKTAGLASPGDLPGPT